MSETPVPAAAAVVLRGSDVLLVRRRNPPDAGLWSFPGGKCHPGETPDQAALRELREETGILARLGAPLGRLSIRTEGFRYDLHVVLCDCLGGSACAADDAIAVAWMPVQDVVAGRLMASRDVDRICLRALSRRC